MENAPDLWDGQGAIQGKMLRVVTFQHLPLSGAHTRGTNFEGAGVAFEVLRLLEETFNFTHRVLPPAKREDELIEQLRRGDADMAVALLPVPLQNRPEGIQFSTAISIDQWVILMKRPEESASGTGLLAPFDTNVWLATLGALMAMGPLMWSLLKLRVYLQNSNRGIFRTPRSSRNIYPLSACVWFAYSAIVKQGSTLAPANDVSRLLFATWWVFITIVTSFYTANLTAFLTLSRFTLPIEEARELPERPDLRWVGRKGGALEHAVTVTDELSYLRNSLNSGSGRFLEVQDGGVLQLVNQGNLYLGERSAVERMVFRRYLQAAKEGLDHSDRCTLVFTSKPFMVRSVALAFPANSSLPALFNPVLRTLVEGGVMRQVLRHDLPEVEICPPNLGSSERQLRNSDLLATYLAMCAGFGAALFTFLAELILRRLRPKTTPVTRLNRLNPLTSFKPSVNHRPVIQPRQAKLPFLYPRDFTLPPSVGKSALIMDPHLFIVHRALNVRVNRPFRRVRVAFAE